MPAASPPTRGTTATADRGAGFDKYTECHGGQATKTVSYTYDYLNRLVGETVVAQDGSALTTTQTALAYDGANVVLKFQDTTTISPTMENPAIAGLGAANLTDRYLWGPVVDQVLADENVTLDAGNAALSFGAWPT